MSWEQMSHHTLDSQKRGKVTQGEAQTQPRSTLEKLMSQAQRQTFPDDDGEFQTVTRKRKPSQNSISSESEEEAKNQRLNKSSNNQKRRHINEPPKVSHDNNPTIVIFNSPDVKLAKINPIKMAKALNEIGQSLIKSVSRTRQQ